MTTNVKEIWRERWLGCINELTSIDLQRKSWTDPTHGNPHWSFMEFICSYFDDLNIDDNYKEPLEKDWIKKQEFEIIKDWHEALDKYNSPGNEDYNADAILKDPQWLDIIRIGLNAKTKLAELLSGREKQALTTEINHI